MANQPLQVILHPCDSASKIEIKRKLGNNITSSIFIEGEKITKAFTITFCEQTNDVIPIPAPDPVAEPQDIKPIGLSRTAAASTAAASAIVAATNHTNSQTRRDNSNCEEASSSCSKHNQKVEHNNREDLEQTIDTSLDNLRPVEGLFDENSIAYCKRQRQRVATNPFDTSDPNSSRTFRTSLDENRCSMQLGSIARINKNINLTKGKLLHTLFKVCTGYYCSRAKPKTIRNKLREFRGFKFEKGSAEYAKRYTILTGLDTFLIIRIGKFLCLPLMRTKNEWIEQIIDFLIEPHANKIVPTTHSDRTEEEVRIKKENFDAEDEGRPSFESSETADAHEAPVSSSSSSSSTE